MANTEQYNRTRYSNEIIEASDEGRVRYCSNRSRSDWVCYCELCRYDVHILVVERHGDVCEGTSKANHVWKGRMR